MTKTKVALSFAQIRRFREHQPGRPLEVASTTLLLVAAPRAPVRLHEFPFAVPNPTWNTPQQKNAAWLQTVAQPKQGPPTNRHTYTHCVLGNTSGPSHLQPPTLPEASMDRGLLSGAQGLDLLRQIQLRQGLAQTKPAGGKRNANHRHTPRFQRNRGSEIPVRSCQAKSAFPGGRGEKKGLLIYMGNPIFIR